MTEFMRPTVTTEEVNDTVARYIVEPLERGYGHTLGNSLRRVLLSSLDGAKATAIQIEGVQHEFTTAEGVIEDITDIVLNVKGLVFSALNDDVTEATAHVLAEGPCTVTGADLDVPTEFTLVNPEHVIATVADGGTLDMTIRIGVGRGYVSAERNKRTEDPIGVIHVDSLFSPVRRCTLNVSDTRVGQRTDYDKLVLEVETDGSIAPTEAVCRAANIVNQYMGAFLSLSNTDEEEGEEALLHLRARGSGVQCRARQADRGPGPFRPLLQLPEARWHSFRPSARRVLRERPAEHQELWCEVHRGSEGQTHFHGPQFEAIGDRDHETQQEGAQARHRLEPH